VSTPGAGDRVVLLDCTALAVAGFFAVPARMPTSEGLHTNALFALSQACRRAIAGQPPTHALAFVEPLGRARPPLQGPATHYPAELRAQQPWFAPTVQAHGMLVCPVDDVLAALALHVADAVHHGACVRVLSADKRALQLVSEGVVVDDPLKEHVWDTASVVRRFGVVPQDLPLLWAWVGDASLGLPGVRGVGPKTAIRKIGVCEAPPESVLIGATRASVGLAAMRPPSWKQADFRQPSPDALNAVYQRLELYALLATSRPAQPVAHFVCDTPAVAAAAMEEVRAHSCVGLWVLADVQLVGIGVAVAPGRAMYFPVAGVGEHLPDLGPLAGWLADPGCAKVVHEATGVFAVLQREGLTLRGLAGDTAFASHRLDPAANLPHDLDQVGRVYLRRAVQRAAAVVGRGASRRGWAELPVGRAGAAACHFADAVVSLWPVVRTQLAAMGQLSELLAVDLPVAEVLAAARLRGVLVEPQKLMGLAADLAASRAALGEEIDRVAGRAVRAGSPADVGKLLFEELALPVLRRTKTGYRTDADVLERLADRHRVVPLLLEWRRLATLERGWAASLPTFVEPSTGRIHSMVTWTASAHGHLVNRDPDLQRVPVKRAVAARARGAFVAGEGHSIVSFDYRQLELRLLGHLSSDPALVAPLCAGVDLHTATAMAVLGLAEDAVGPAERELGKQVNFATLYGQGANSLAISLGVERDEAERVIASIYARFRVARAWQAEQLAHGERLGWVATVTGRRRLLHELGSRESALRAYGERLARNFPVQGSAADVVRLAVRDTHRALGERGIDGGLLLVLKDELIFELPDVSIDAAVACIRSAMQRVLPLAVPLPVRVGVGRSWAEAAPRGPTLG
jgi:DNA polymerase I